MAKAAKSTATLNTELLASIVAATKAGSHLHIQSTDDAKFLVDNNYIEVNTEIVNEDGAASRATEKGIATMATENTDEKAPATPADKPAFAISRGAPITRKRAPNGTASIYPFDKLQAPDETGNDEFFVPATTARPNPWKLLASAVSQAKSRYATDTGERKTVNGKDGKTIERKVYRYSREFVIAEGERDGVKGAIIQRTK